MVVSQFVGLVEPIGVGAAGVRVAYAEGVHRGDDPRAGFEDAAAGVAETGAVLVRYVFVIGEPRRYPFAHAGHAEVSCCTPGV
jgi:hypothetical protein